MDKSDLLKIPMEISIGGIYFPPILLAIVIGTCLSWGIAILLKKLNLTEYIWYPALFFFALIVICTWFVIYLFIPI